MSVNIGNSSDPFYRYKRPTSIIENKANKTKIINLDLIAKALKTKPSYIIYYIQITKSTSINGKYEINKILTKAEIESLIDHFIDAYILCTKCRYPELVINKTDSKLYFDCNACGNSTSIIENKFTKIIYKDNM